MNCHNLKTCVAIACIALVSLWTPAYLILSALGFENAVKAFIGVPQEMPEWAFRASTQFAFIMLLFLPLPVCELAVCGLCSLRVLRFVRRPSSPTPETTPNTDATLTSIDDDWADIALELKKENDHA